MVSYRDNDLQEIVVHGEKIQILPAPCYLATKIEAFKDRGGDYRTSHDIEDVVYILDNRTNIVEEISVSPDEVRYFIRNELNKLIANRILDDVLAAHIHPLMIEDRLPLVKQKIINIINFP